MIIYLPNIWILHRCKRDPHINTDPLEGTVLSSVICNSLWWPLGSAGQVGTWWHHSMMVLDSRRWYWGDSRSALWLFACGTTQGSILSPIVLFNIYMKSPGEVIWWFGVGCHLSWGKVPLLITPPPNGSTLCTPRQQTVRFSIQNRAPVIYHRWPSSFKCKMKFHDCPISPENSSIDWFLIIGPSWLGSKKFG